MRSLVGLVAVVSSAAFAQGFELDLSEPEVPPEFRPTIAVIGVTSGEGPEDTVNGVRAQLMEAELIKAVSSNANFGQVMNPTEAASELGAGAAAARKCVDFACLEAIAKKLKVDRLVKGTVTRSGPASVLTLHAFDAALPEVVHGSLESSEKAERAQAGGFAGIQGKSQAQKDKDFSRKVSPLFFEVLEKIKTANGKITVDSAEASSVTLLNGVELGIGAFEKVVPRGSYEVKVAAVGYNTYEQKIVVEPQKVSAVKVLLVAKELEKAPVVVAEAPKGTPVIMRPGLYIAVAGLVSLGAGIALGVGAKGVESRAIPDANNIVPISRTEAKVAKNNAMLANVFMGVGALATIGGGVWFFLTPGIEKVKKKEEAPPVDAAPVVVTGEGLGVMVGYGGSF